MPAPFTWLGKSYNQTTGAPSDAFLGKYFTMAGTDENIKCGMGSLNVATISCKTIGGPIPVGTMCTIQASTRPGGAGGREIFFGMIKSYTAVTQVVNGAAVYKYQLAEAATVLEQTRVSITSMASLLFVVPFTGSRLYVSNGTGAIEVILGTTGQTVNTGGTGWRPSLVSNATGYGLTLGSTGYDTVVKVEATAYEEFDDDDPTGIYTPPRTVYDTATGTYYQSYKNSKWVVTGLQVTRQTGDGGAFNPQTATGVDLQPNQRWIKMTLTRYWKWELMNNG